MHSESRAVRALPSSSSLAIVSPRAAWMVLRQIDSSSTAGATCSSFAQPPRLSRVPTREPLDTEPAPSLASKERSPKCMTCGRRQGGATQREGASRSVSGSRCRLWRQTRSAVEAGQAFDGRPKSPRPPSCREAAARPTRARAPPTPSASSESRPRRRARRVWAPTSRPLRVAARGTHASRRTRRSSHVPTRVPRTACRRRDSCARPPRAARAWPREWMSPPCRQSVAISGNQ